MELAAPPLNWLFIGGHVVVWMMILLFLARSGTVQQIAQPHIDLHAGER